MKIEKTEIPHCEKCDNTLLFELNNGKERYALNIEVVLSCLKLAEGNHAIPPLAPTWWQQIKNHYQIFEEQ